MVKEEENENIENAIFQTKIRCLDCDCIGVLRKKGKKVYLMPEEVLTTRSIHTQKSDVIKLIEKTTWKKKVTAKMSLAKHGNATNQQQFSYLTLGSIFWVTVMLIANFASLEKSLGATTFLTSTCHQNYKKCVKISTMDFCGHLMKQCRETKEFILPEPASKVEHVKAAPLVFSEEENEVNLRRCQKKRFYDQKVCRHLCSNTLVLKSTRTSPITPCESICFGLTRSFDSAGEVCPFQKYCSKGCPCPHYQCEKLESPQKLVPVFDLRKSEKSSTPIESTSTQSTSTGSTLTTWSTISSSTQSTISATTTPAATSPITTSTQSTLSLINSTAHSNGSTELTAAHEVEEPNFTILLADFNGQNQPRKTSASDFLDSYSTGATFLNGEHYLVDAIGNLMKVKENDDSPTIIPNRLKNIGRFVFHFGSSIGTHHIEIRLKDKDRKIFPVVVICSPDDRPDKCYYYAPDYNLNRFETAQGYIASNHINAKTSSISFGGTFILMSLRLGRNWIIISKTVALNSIRATEELEKGWKKDEIAVPAMFRDFDPVHVIPLIDLGQLMLILVTRSIALSNTRYSLLLEKEGKFLTLGNEWIGSLVSYERESRCFSGLYAPKDYAYSNAFGTNNDECEYFINGFINNDRIYLQNMVFDTTFEIYFDFDHIELDFRQQSAENKMLVTSNPYFEFHKDVFPFFAKNAVKEQMPFPQSASSLSPPYPLAILPDYPFSSFNESLFHISSFELDFNETRKLTLDIKTKSSLTEAAKILEFRSYDEESIFAVETFENSSIAISSDFFEESIALDDPLSTNWASLEFVFQVEDDSLFSLVVMRRGEEIARRQMNELQTMGEKRIRVFKFDDETEIKNVFFYQNQQSQILVILSEPAQSPHQYALFGDGFKNENTNIIIPTILQNKILYSRAALVKGHLHFFGGRQREKLIIILVECELRLLPIRLQYKYSYGSAALTISNGTEALVCFDDPNDKKCEIFNGTAVEELAFEPRKGHWEGGLAHFKGRPTAVGGGNYPKPNKGYTETLTENGWEKLPRHPIALTEFSVVELPSGSIATLGGWDRDKAEVLKEIFALNKFEWTLIGNLLQPSYYGTAIQVGTALYLFPGESDRSTRLIQRVNLDRDNIVAVEVVGEHEKFHFSPILFLTPSNFCDAKHDERPNQ